jgi:hypothetical protein
VPRERFVALVRNAVAQPGQPGRWRFDLRVPSAPEHLPAP